MTTIMVFNKENIADRFEIDLHDKDIEDLAERLYSTYDLLYYTNIEKRLYGTLTKEEFVVLLMSYDEMIMRYEDHALSIFSKDRDTIMIEGCVLGNPVDIMSHHVFSNDGDSR